MSEIYNYFWNASGYGLFLIISVFYIFYCEKRCDIKSVLGMYSGILLIVILNPLTFMVVSFFLNTIQLYSRTYLLIPIAIVIAYALTRVIVNCQGKKGKKIGLTLLLVFVICFTGRSFYFDENIFQIADNMEKMPKDLKEVCEIIQDNGECNRAIVPPELISYIRQYDSNIKLCYGRYNQECTLGKEFVKDEPDMEWLVRKLREDYECNYVVYSSNSERIIEEFQNYGFKIVGITNDYVVLKDEKEK